MKHLKEKIYASCIDLLNNKIKEFNTILLDLTSGVENDSKSSAGDKHETGRAMMQIEHEKISRQLAEVKAQLDVLQKIDIHIQSPKITKGSFIKTDKNFFFLSVAIGKLTVDGQSVMVLSAQSPLGQKFLGLSIKDLAEINGYKYLIEELQ